MRKGICWFYMWKNVKKTNFKIEIVTHRIQKINELIKRHLGAAILKEIRFANNVLVTVTRVETFANLERAKIWVSVIPEKEFQDTLKILNQHSRTLQKKLNQLLRIRKVPKIEFLEDKKVVEAQRIEKFLEKIKLDRNQNKGMSAEEE